MFKKKRPVGLLEPSVENFETIIGPAAEVHGRIVTSKGLRVDGKIIGNIEAQSGSEVCVALGKTGAVMGDIYAYRVLVAGVIEGNIYATERVELHDGSEVRGDVTYGQLGIEHGAKLNGLMIARANESTDELEESNS